MHPQTLRIYESKGLIQPKRSPKNTRLYSQRDVERLRRIQQMTNEQGLNLAGVETVLEMEERVDAMRSELDAMRARTRELEDQLTEEMKRVQRLHTEIVPYGAYEADLQDLHPHRLAAEGARTLRHRQRHPAPIPDVQFLRVLRGALRRPTVQAAERLPREGGR